MNKKNTIETRARDWAAKNISTIADNYEREQRTIRQYYYMLRVFNRVVRMVGDDSKEEFYFRHLLDSLMIFKFLQLEKGEAVCDIGSGAGFPGFPIKILERGVKLISVESNKKKAEFQRQLASKLKIKDIVVLNERVEVVGRSEQRERMDIVVSRAVSDMPVIIEYSLPLLKTGGICLMYRGKKPEKELGESENAMEVLGAKLEEVYKYRIRKDDPERSLVKVRKVAETDEKYPRRLGIPSKRPL